MTESRSREEYIEWLQENASDFECSRCGLTCNGERVETRLGTVDVGCYLHWQTDGTLAQRTLADFGGDQS